MGRRISKDTQFTETRGKYLWRNKSYGIHIRRIGPEKGRLSYMVKWRGGWGVMAAHEIRPTIELLMRIDADVEGRVARGHVV